MSAVRLAPEVMMPVKVHRGQVVGRHGECVEAVKERSWWAQSHFSVLAQRDPRHSGESVWIVESFDQSGDDKFRIAGDRNVHDAVGQHM